MNIHLNEYNYTASLMHGVYLEAIKILSNKKLSQQAMIEILEKPFKDGEYILYKPAILDYIHHNHDIIYQLFSRINKMHKIKKYIGEITQKASFFPEVILESSDLCMVGIENITFQDMIFNFMMLYLYSFNLDNYSKLFKSYISTNIEYPQDMDLFKIVGGMQHTTYLSYAFYKALSKVPDGDVIKMYDKSLKLYIVKNDIMIAYHNKYLNDIQNTYSVVSKGNNNVAFGHTLCNNIYDTVMTADSIVQEM